MAQVPEAQAVTGQLIGPLAPKRMETWPAARLASDRGDGERGHLPGAAQEDRLLFLFDGGQSADGGADDHAGPLRFACADGQAGIGQGHLGGGQGIDDEIIQAPQFFFVHVLERIEALQFAGDLRFEGRAVELRDAGDAGFPRADPLPGFRDGVAERRDGAHARDHHPSFQLFPLLRIGLPADKPLPRTALAVGRYSCQTTPLLLR